MSALRVGDPVRFVVSDPRNTLGAMDRVDGTRFTATVSNGDGGVYAGRHPTLVEWHVCTVERDGATLYVPVHEAHFTAAETE